MKSTPKTPVIFRTFKDGGDVIAVFPLEPHDRAGWNMLSYQRMGQHGAASPELIRGSSRGKSWHDCATRPSLPHEIQPLREELTKIGYDLRELKRTPGNAYNVRKGKASQ